MKQVIPISAAILLFAGLPLSANQITEKIEEKFVAVPICRVLDTRTLPATTGPEMPIPIDISATVCGRDIPSSATRYSLRVTKYGRAESAGAIRSTERPEVPAGIATFAIPPDSNITVDIEGYYAPQTASANQAAPAASTTPKNVLARPVPLSDQTVNGNLYVSGGNINVTNSAGPYNGVLYSGDPNWGFAVSHPASPSDDYETRLNYYPNPGGNRKAGLFNVYASSYALYADTNFNPNVIIPTGYLGVGATPSEKLDVSGGNIKVTGSAGPYNGTVYSGDPNWGLSMRHPGSPADDYEVRLNYYPNTGGNRKAGIYNSNTNGYALYADSNTNPNIIVPSGNVGIGTPNPTALLTVGDPTTPTTSITVAINGSIDVSGNINAKYQDMAEWVPATTSMIPGAVVVLNRERPNEVMLSRSAYDTAVAGVVSAQPGLLLGERSGGKEMITTTGRVRVRVDASKLPIRIGDLLVTSDRPGMAMRSEPIDIGGTKIHRPGTLIGKALEPLQTGEGEILVLLSLQ